MKLRHVEIQNFRGIQTLSWFVDGDFICLVGPGDSCKSTVLDALELVFTPRWNPSFNDADFFELRTDKALVIKVTIGDLPRHLLSDAKYGLRLRGFDASQPLINDEPLETDEEVITIRLTVGSSLEPAWEVVTDRHADGVAITAVERERLGVLRLGAVVDRELSWSRGSSLSRLTSAVDEHSQMMADASRGARQAVDPARLPNFGIAAKRAQELCQTLGVSHRGELGPRMDPASAALGTGGLALHDGEVPLRRSGLGTRRLVTLAVQRHLAGNGGLILVDEIEHGLEPYRLRRLLSELVAPSGPEAEPSEGEPSARKGVIMLTTHSPVAIGQLRAEHLRIVRANSGTVTVRAPTIEAQGTLIQHPDAFLSRRVIICEGRTELGLVLGLDEVWMKSGLPFASAGVGLVDAGGISKVASTASSFAKLGYPTAILADSDAPLTTEPDELRSLGICVVLWDGSMATEQRLFTDLPWSAVVEMVANALDHEIDVKEKMASKLKVSPNALQDIDTWRGSFSEADLRKHLGDLAKSGGWFKNVRLGTQLGRLVASSVDATPDTDTAQKVTMLRSWAFQ